MLASLTTNSGDDDEAGESLLASHHDQNGQFTAYHGGLSGQILRIVKSPIADSYIPLSYKDSLLVPSEWKTAINEYIRHVEYAMSVAVLLSGTLNMLLEKHNFKSFDDHYKVPIYMLIGSSLAFLVAYGLFDFVELAHAYVDRRLSAKN